MSEFICLLVTVLQESGVYGPSLLRTALKVHRDSLGENAVEFPMEHRDEIKKLLPPHVHGPIVEIERIFEIVTYDNEPPPFSPTDTLIGPGPDNYGEGW